MYRKVLLLSSIILLNVIACYSQDSLKVVSYGIRGGFGLSTIQPFGKYSGRLSYKNTIQLGGFAEVKLGKKIFLQAELLYSSPGIKLIRADKKGNVVADSSIVMNAIQLPLQIKLKTGNEKVKAYYMGGIAPSFFLDARLKYKVDTTNTFMTYTDFVNRSTLNIINTIGFEVDIDELVIPFIDFRYVQGITPIFRDPYGYQKPFGQYNVQFLLSTGVKF